MKKTVSLVLALLMLLSLCACGGGNVTETEPAETSGEVTVTDMIGREVTVVPGSYTRVV